jgi:hypothetical protein
MPTVRRREYYSPGGGSSPGDGSRPGNPDPLTRATDQVREVDIARDPEVQNLQAEQTTQQHPSPGCPPVQETDAIVHGALKRVWTRLNETYRTEHSVIVFLHIISRLDDNYRQYGAQLILE